LNLIADAPLWLVVLLACAVIAAAIEDALRYRISNVTTLLVIAGAICAAIIEGPSWSLWHNLVVFAAILAIGTAAFAAGLFGGGDVKLFAAVGFWVNLQAAFSLILLIFLSGGIVAVAYLAARAFRNTGQTSRERRVPYGVAIAVGSLILIGFARAPHQPSYRTTPQLQTGTRL